MKRLIIGALIACLPMLAQADADADRKEIQDMRTEVLSTLFKEKSDAKGKVEGAKGYAVFSNLGVNLLVVSTARGGGVLRDNRSGKDTYMKMFSAGGGLGLGVKDFAIVFVFNTDEALDNFVSSGWDFSAQADAKVEADDTGGGEEHAATLIPGVEIYQMTEAGVALQATLQGTKYWKDDELN